MENLNRQGKTIQQCKDSESFILFSIIGILILIITMLWI